MTKIYLFKIQNEFIGSDFSKKMSLKYSDEIARNRSNYMWYKLEEILKLEYNILITHNDIIFGQYGKPMMKNNNIHFNISHCKDLGIIGISNQKIGVDIEMLIDDAKSKFIKKYFDFDDSIDNISLTKKWVSYEAKCKLLGDGLPIKYQNKDVECKMYEDTITYNNAIFYISIAYNDKEELGGIYNGL